MAGEGSYTTISQGFQFQDDEQPKTPERELSPIPIIKQPSPRVFRVKRRARQRLNTMSISSRTSEIMAGLQEDPLPSIELLEHEGTMAMNIDPPQPEQRLFTPLGQTARSLPYAPSEARIRRACTPLQPEIPTKTIERPLSPFSTVSDSSDDSFIDSEDEFSYGGSVTSPDSDGTDPFSFESPSKLPNKSQSVVDELPQSQTPRKISQKKFWTKEMDSHMWAIYMTYLNDPTVTPFKTLPGCPPPVGVCHRVAREARKTWKSGRILSAPPKPQQSRREGSPDTITAQSEHATPTVSPRNPAWPGGGSATRKRFRELCKRKATIIPHYQRMLRSASPYLVDTQARSNRAGSPFIARDSFATRDVTASLAASTSSTMRPDGPLAQIGKDGGSDWFNAQPQGPWASPASIPSDVENHERIGASITRLGSPFSGSHTWGPSRTKTHERPRATSLHPATTDIIPRLRSPVHFATVSALKAPSLYHSARTPKRPAQTALDDELSNVEVEARRNRHDGIFGDSLQNASRRLRLRGMSLGTNVMENVEHPNSEPNTVVRPVINTQPQASLFSSLPPVGVYAIGIEDPFGNPIRRQDPTPRLGSPFPGISSRPSRARGRHIPSLSAPMAPSTDLGSIDHRMTQNTPPYD